MKAMIFAAGLGTRLKPLTDTLPKALVPLAGKPLLQWQIERLKAAGITDIVVNVHHFPDMIINYLPNIPLNESILLGDKSSIFFRILSRRLYILFLVSHINDEIAYTEYPAI